MKVGIIDYGVGNYGSVLVALESLQVTSILITEPAEIAKADVLILPGVGSFSNCASLLKNGGWIPVLFDEVIVKELPLLGICLGMHLLAYHSTEGASAGQVNSGTGLIPGHVEHLRDVGSTCRVPHVGWNSISRSRIDDCLLANIPDGSDFYFSHSYVFVPSDPNDVIAFSEHGIKFAAAVHRGNVWGTQFHPEKSSQAGFRLLRNFIEINSC